MTLVLLCLAALAVVAFATSVLTATGLACLGGLVERLAPSAQSRVQLWVALLPLLVSIATLAAALAPSFGWIADHCGSLAAGHLHAHICAHHPDADAPALPLLVLAFALASRIVWALASRLEGLLTAGRVRRALDATSRPGASPRVRILPVDTAQAFVLGLFRPTLYVTRALASGPCREHLPVVLAHEQAHLLRRDPLRRFVAGLALAFHVPLVARWLDRCLATSQEMAADDVAALAVGSRDRVARAVLELSRSSLRLPSPALSFSGSEVEARVRQLLEPPRRLDHPTTSALLLGAAASVVGIALGAEAVHHAIEHLLAAVGS